MKIGIIIIFHNNEDDIDTKYFIDKISQTKHLELCFVNNESRDSTYQLLEEIKYQCSNVSIVNIKKFKSDVSAVRAGARYMFSQYDLEHLGYVTTNLLKTRKDGLNALIDAITENQELIVEYNSKVLKRHLIKRTLFQKLFSIVDYLKKLKVDNQFIHLQVVNKL